MADKISEKIVGTPHPQENLEIQSLANAISSIFKRYFLGRIHDFTKRDPGPCSPGNILILGPLNCNFHRFRGKFEVVQLSWFTFFNHAFILFYFQGVQPNHPNWHPQIRPRFPTRKTITIESKKLLLSLHFFIYLFIYFFILFFLQQNIEQSKFHVKRKLQHFKNYNRYRNKLMLVATDNKL